MLNALKSQLSMMALEDGAIFARQVRKRIGSKKAKTHVSNCLNLVLMMPDLVARCRDLSESKAVPGWLREFNGFLLTYLYHPIDFLPEDGLGLFGYLDDAYFVGRVFQMIRERVPGISSSAEDLYRDLPMMLDSARTVLAPESAQVDRLISEIGAGRRDLFNQLMNKTPQAPR